MIRKVLSVSAIIICLVMIFTTNAFALEYVDFNNEIDILCDYVPGKVIITTSDTGNDEVINILASEYNFTDYSLLIAGNQNNGYVKSIYSAKVDTDNIAKLAYSISQERGVYSAEPDYIGERMSDGMPYDESNETETIWHKDDLGFDEMQRYLSTNNITPRTVRIAVLDSGIDINCSYISGNLIDIEDNGNHYHGYCVTQDSVNYLTTPNPYVRHGTSVISLICGSTSLGINSDVEIIPIDVRVNNMEYYSDDFEDTNRVEIQNELSSFIRGLGVIAGNTKLVNNVEIITASMGFSIGTVDDNIGLISSLKTAVDFVEDEGIIFFAAAGNKARPIYNLTNENNFYGNGMSEYFDPDYDSDLNPEAEQHFDNDYRYVVFPAAFDSVIGVMGYNKHGDLWGRYEEDNGTNYGIAKHRTSNDTLGYDVIAPANSIYLLTCSSSGVYSLAFDKGTSFAAPLAAGVTAYYLGLMPANSTFTKDDIVNLYHKKFYTKNWYDANAHIESVYEEYIPTVSLIDVISAHAFKDTNIICDVNGNYLYGFEEMMDLTDLQGYLTGLTASHSITIGSGSSQYYSTGAKVNLTDSDNNTIVSYTVIVFGDVDGDGHIGISDYFMMYDYKNDPVNYPIDYPVAGDVVNFGDGITNNDILQVKLVATGYFTISQIPHYWAFIFAREGTTCVVDYENYIIYGLCENLTRGLLINDYVEIYGEYVLDKGDFRYFGTGSTITLQDGDNNDILTYDIIIFGDLDGNGIIELDDAAMLSEYYAHPEYAPDYPQGFAGDVVNFGDGITQDDVDLLYAAIAGLEEISQNP